MKLGIVQAMPSSWKGRNCPSAGDFRVRGGLTRARARIYAPRRTDRAEWKFWSNRNSEWLGRPGGWESDMEIKILLGSSSPNSGFFRSLVRPLMSFLPKST